MQVYEWAEGQMVGQIVGHRLHLAAELAGAPAAVRGGIPAARLASAAPHWGKRARAPAARSSAHALSQRASRAEVDVLAADHHT